jgi:deazaflavin-dependent oxidoreductase (nitroreductase family)
MTAAMGWKVACAVVPSDLTFKALNAAHRSLLRLTGGRVGWRAGGMPVLELTTIGRKSGRPRSVMLPSPVQEGERWVVVASRGGNDHHPAWFLNLRDRPDVEVSRKGKPRQSMRARIATPDERARLWPRVTATYNGYAGYQEKADREIPLVWLEPRN